jgi:hypothetical protein
VVVLVVTVTVVVMVTKIVYYNCSGGSRSGCY